MHVHGAYVSDVHKLCRACVWVVAWLRDVVGSLDECMDEGISPGVQTQGRDLRQTTH